MRTMQIYYQIFILLIIITTFVYPQEIPDCSDLEVKNLKFTNSIHDTLLVTVYNDCDSCIQHAYTGIIAYKYGDTLATSPCLTCRISSPNNEERDYYLITRKEFEISDINKIEMRFVCDDIPFSSILNINENDNGRLNSYNLYQNYPNPFNPTTVIKYSIPNSDYVAIKVYDMLGKEISTLVDEFKSAGDYQIEFNGRNLTSGVYFYKLQAGNYSSIKKLLLIR